MYELKMYACDFHRPNMILLKTGVERTPLFGHLIINGLMFDSVAIFLSEGLVCYT